MRSGSEWSASSMDLCIAAASRRALVAPAGRGKCGKKDRSVSEDKTSRGRHGSMTWSHRGIRASNSNIETCEKCKGPMRITPYTEDPLVI